MKKAAAIILLLLLVAGATGCQRRDSRPKEESSSLASQGEDRSSRAEEPSQGSKESEEESEEADTGKVVAAAEEMLTALQSGDRDRIKAHLDYTNLLQLQEGQPDTNHLAILRQLRYAVGEAKVNGATATVTVQLTNVDMKVALSSFFKAAGELEYNNALSDQPRTESELEADYIRLFQDILEANRANTVEHTVNVTMLQAGGAWRAQVSEELRNAALGDYFIAQSQVGIGAGEV